MYQYSPWFFKRWKQTGETWVNVHYKGTLAFIDFLMWHMLIDFWLCSQQFDTNWFVTAMESSSDRVSKWGIRVHNWKGWTKVSMYLHKAIWISSISGQFLRNVDTRDNLALTGCPKSNIAMVHSSPLRSSNLSCSSVLWQVLGTFRRVRNLDMETGQRTTCYLKTWHGSMVRWGRQVECYYPMSIFSKMNSCISQEFSIRTGHNAPIFYS